MVYCVVIYWPDGLTSLVGCYATVKEACAVAMQYKQISDSGKITVASF